MENDLKDILFRKFEGLNYIILRNHENIEEDIQNGGDIDILCESKELFENVDGISPIGNEDNGFNYQLNIDGLLIPIDLRFVGDGYYDKKWEKKMLEKKVRYENFFVMDAENYLYSIIYHALVHKTQVDSKYLRIFEKEFGLTDENKIIDKLVEYMVNSGFSVTKPIDNGVIYNRKVVKRLRRLIFCSRIRGHFNEKLC